MNKPYHAVIEVINPECQVLQRLQSKGIMHFDIADIRCTASGKIRHLVEISTEHLTLLEGRSSRRKKRAHKTGVWIESEGCSVCNAILAQNSFLISGKRARGEVFVYSFVTPDFKSYKEILRMLESMGFQFKVVKAGTFTPRGDILTRTQEKVLWYALKTGYFEYPRRIDTNQLARLLGVSPPTVSEIVRRGIRRLLEHYFEAKFSSNERM